MPFRPFLIARRRHIAFLWRTLFAYLDNLLAWADSLFRRDTRESIGEATLLYVLAARILGPRPKIERSSRTRKAVTYAEAAKQWDDFANLWIDTGWRIGLAAQENGQETVVHHIDSPNGFLYFCIPFNDKLSTYWNTVEEGVVA